MSGPGWSGAGREILVAALLIVTLTAAAWMIGGAPAAGLVLLICVAVSLIALRAMIEPHEEPAEPPTASTSALQARSSDTGAPARIFNRPPGR